MLIFFFYKILDISSWCRNGNGLRVVGRRLLYFLIEDFARHFVQPSSLYEVTLQIMNLKSHGEGLVMR